MGCGLVTPHPHPGKLAFEGSHALDTLVTVTEQFSERLATALRDGTFVRLVLNAAAEPRKTLGRLVVLKDGPHLSLTYRFATRDVTKNLPVTDIRRWLSEQTFTSALLGTTTSDWQLAKGRLIRHKPSATAPPARTHDRQKRTFLDESATVWLDALGIEDAKYAQINRYLEIMTHLAKGLDLRVIADMGCGKGYLTFGLWHLLRNQPVRIVGVEQRPELVEAGNELARRIGATGLEFVAGTIQSVPLPAVDALIALHACDTATDDAIQRGIELGAKLIVVSPCCHQQVRPQMAHPGPLAPVLAHGIMAERMAEWVTDGARALHLEWAGYRTKVFEFVASEHTPKNLMIAGLRERAPFTDATARQRLDEFRRFYGLD